MQDIINAPPWWFIGVMGLMGCSVLIPLVIVLVVVSLSKPRRNREE